MTAVNRVSLNTYSLVFGVVYLGLATNVMLVIACLPEIALFALTDPAEAGRPEDLVRYSVRPPLLWELDVVEVDGGARLGRGCSPIPAWPLHG